MPKAETHPLYKKLHGKPNKSDKGYFYVIKDQQFYREREENYQQNQSPRQKWNSAAFKAANSQLKLILNNPASNAQMETDYETANHIATNGKAYTTIRAWKFNSLLHDYKQAHPFEQQ